MKNPAASPPHFLTRQAGQPQWGVSTGDRMQSNYFLAPGYVLADFFFFFRKRILACWAVFLLNCLLQKSRGKHCSEGLWNESAFFLRKPEVMSRMRLLSGEARRWLSPANNAPSLDPVALLLALAAAM